MQFNLITMDDSVVFSPRARSPDDNALADEQDPFQDIDMHQLLLCNPSFKLLSQAGKNSHAKYKTKIANDESKKKPDCTGQPPSPLPISTKYNSLAQWQINDVDTKIKSAYLRVVKFILLREESLLKLDGLCSRLDESYWQYAHIRGALS